MNVESVKSYLENSNSGKINGDGLPLRFFERLIMRGLRVDLIETGRLLCTFKVPSRLLNGDNYLHGGAVATLVDLVSSVVVCTVGAPLAGFSVEINISYFGAAYADEEIEIEARALHVGKSFVVLSVEFKKKNTGKIIIQGRHTKYILLPSKI